MKSTLTTLALIIGAFSLLKAQSTKDILTRFTNDYFEAYNKCLVEEMLSLCTDDIEVYHDLVGLINLAFVGVANRPCAIVPPTKKPLLFTFI